MADMGARPRSQVGKTRLKIHMKLSNFIQTPRVDERILPGSNHHLKVTPPRNTSGQRGSAMHDSPRYRHNAAQCLLAAKEASQPCSSATTASGPSAVPRSNPKTSIEMWSSIGPPQRN
jgi:hypothetical protein